MKITKIKTRKGVPGAPASVEFDDIVERMRSEETKGAANLIAVQADDGKGGAQVLLGGC